MKIEELRDRLRPICEQQALKRLDLFGSRARSTGASGRDFDFVVELPESPPAEYAERFFRLLHALEDELGESVDLITYGSLAKESLRSNIEKERVVIYGG